MLLNSQLWGFLLVTGNQAFLHRVKIILVELGRRLGFSLDISCSILEALIST